jgi:gluconate 2-dehydrogenase gamma chain
MSDDGGVPADPSRRGFLKFGAGVVVASAAEAPFVNRMFSQNSKISSLKSQLSALHSQAVQVSQLQSSIAQANSEAQTAQSHLLSQASLLYLSLDEAAVIEAAAETIIPSDGNGPGAKEAGVIYFIDRQLASDYGTSGTMYMQGPFVPPGTPGPVTVNGQTYPDGTPEQRITAGTRYQYAMNLRYFWYYGTHGLQDYSNTAYGSDFQQLSAEQRAQALADLWNNKPTSFNSIVPEDFAYELFFMVWSGFLTDPLNGGNAGMVGWQLVGFNAANFGDFYKEGQSQLELAQASKPTTLRPASLAQFQQAQQRS